MNWNLSFSFVIVGLLEIDNNITLCYAVLKCKPCRNVKSRSLSSPNERKEKNTSLWSTMKESEKEKDERDFRLWLLALMNETFFFLLVSEKREKYYERIRKFFLWFNTLLPIQW